jgi:phage shock protein PspC (stress-responsive transcriptional regulator)
MNFETRVRFLKVSLLLVGLTFSFGLYFLMNVFWPSGWRWHPYQSEYEQMIVGVYATLGLFLVIASRNPLRHRSLIWFTVWSSLVHSAIMAVQAVNMSGEHAHLTADVPALFLVAVILALLLPKSSSADETAGVAAGKYFTKGEFK